MTEKHSYWAFISYSHADEAWAKWLHKALETYRVPARLVGSRGPFGPRPRRLFPIFRDRDELSSAAELSAVIEAALRESRYLIIICSPNSAKSQWVDAEIRRFKSLGRDNRVFALIVDGEPNAAQPAQECFPLALRRKVDRKAQLTDEPSEPIAADARPFADHKHGAKLKLIAGLLGVGYDELRQRERQRRFWMRVQQAIAGVAALAVLAALWGWFQHREARLVAEARLDRLVHLGRQELNEQRNARAAVYFAEALRGGRDTVPLRYWLARAMQPVDAVRPRMTDLGQIVVNATPMPDGRALLSLSENLATLRALDDGALIHSFPLPYKVFLGPPQISGDARHAAITGAASTDGEVDETQTTVLDLDAGRVVATLPGLLWPGRNRRFSPDGKRLLLATQPAPTSPDKPHVAVYELDSGRELARLTGPDGVVIPSFSDDGRQIVAGGEGRGEIRIWDAASYRLLHTIRPRQQIAHSVYWTGRGSELMSINEAGAIKLWDGDSGELLDALGSHSLFAIAVDAAAQRYWMTSSVDGTKVWDLESGQVLFSTDRFGGFPADAALDRGGAHILAAEHAGGALWNVAERAREQFLDVHSAKTAVQYFSADDRMIVSVSGNGGVRWLDTQALVQPRARLEHDSYVNPQESPGIDALALGADGASWISGGADGAVRRWRVTDGAPESHLRPHDSRIRQIALALDGKLIVSGDSGGRVVAWDGQAEQPAWTLETGTDVTALRTSPGGGRLIVEGADGHARLMDAASGTQIADMEPDPTLAAVLPLDETGRILRIGRKGGLIVHSLQSDTAPRTLTADEPQSVISDVTRAGQGVIVQSADTVIRVIDIASGATQASIDLRNTAAASLYVRTLASSADGRWVAAGTLEGPLVLWQPGATAVRVLEGHGHAVATVTFDPAGSLLASATNSGEIVVWQIDSGQPLQRFDNSRNRLSVLAFDRSGQRLLDGDRLGSALRLRDVSVEHRPLADIDRRIACAVPWALQGTELVQRTPEAADCADITTTAGPE